MQTRQVDTLLFEVDGLPNAPGKNFRSQMIRTTEPGAGRDLGLIVHTTDTRQWEQDGSPGLRSQERVTADARSFAFRSSWRLTDLASGNRLQDVTQVLDGKRIRQVSVRDGGADTTWVNLPSDKEPFASLHDLVHGTRITSAWRGTYEVFIASPPFHIGLVIDSAAPLRASGVGARWLVHGHADSALKTLTRMTAIIDSTTQDILQLEWRRVDGIHTVITSSRFAVRASVAAVPALAVGDASFAGRYRLEGEREAGSELMLNPDGRFEYMLAYGALDESGAGRWRVVDGAVVLQSDKSAHAASVTLASATGTASDSIVFVVVDSAGHILPNLTLDFSRAGSSRFTVQTTTKGYTLNFRKGMPPSEVGVSIAIFDFRAAFPLSGVVHSTYRFVFDPGDLGIRRFDGERLRVEDSVLIMTRDGHRMRYVRH